MSPYERGQWWVDSGPPRASGDEPSYDAGSVAVEGSAPRERG